MEDEVYNTNMNRLKEIILDEEKIVTYYSISKDLCIHVNESKLLLESFIKEIEKNKPNVKLHAEYLISGLCKDNIARTKVCSDKNVDKEKNDMKIVFFCHIYSLCKGSCKVDKVALMSLSSFEDFALYTGLVKSNLCARHTSNEMELLRSNSQEAVIPVQSNVLSKLKKPTDIKKDNNSTIKTLESVNNGLNSTPKLQETKSEPIIKKENVSPKKDVVSKQKSDIKTGKKAQKGIVGFFSKSNSDPGKKLQNGTGVIKKESNKTETPIVKMEVAKNSASEKSILKDSIDNEVDKRRNITEHEEKMDTEENVDTEKIDKSNSINKKVESKLNQIKRNAKVDKKRKRLLHVSDSESEDERNDPFVREETVKQESDDEIPPTPATNTVKVTSGMLNPKKKRKIVDKTYMDDDGYIHTKKEEIYESCSDNEETPVTKDMKENIKLNVKTENSPKKVKNGRKKPSPPQKGKQPTLTNFFKRK